MKLCKFKHCLAAKRRLSLPFMYTGDNIACDDFSHVIKHSEFRNNIKIHEFVLLNNVDFYFRFILFTYNSLKVFLFN